MLAGKKPIPEGMLELNDGTEDCTVVQGMEEESDDGFSSTDGDEEEGREEREDAWHKRNEKGEWVERRPLGVTLEEVRCQLDCQSLESSLMTYL